MATASDEPTATAPPAARATAFDPRLVLGQAEAVTASAASIAAHRRQVSDGALSQIQSLDDALAGLTRRWRRR